MQVYLYLSVPWDTWQTSRHMMNFNPEIPADDTQRQDKIKEHLARNFNQEWLAKLKEHAGTSLLSPPAFRHKLTRLAQAS